MRATRKQNLTAKISNVTFDALDHTGKRGAIGWEMGGARFHFWTAADPAAIAVEQDVIYKNPPLGIEQHQPGFYWPRKLDATKAAQAEIVEIVVEIVRRETMIENALAARAAAIVEERRQEEAAHRVALKQSAGPALYPALAIAHDYLLSWRIGNADPMTLAPEQWMSLSEGIQAALCLADTGRIPDEYQASFDELMRGYEERQARKADHVNRMRDATRETDAEIDRIRKGGR